MADGKALAHGYRALQHWNQWLTQHFLGNHLLHEEQHLLAHLLHRHFGKHALLIGVPRQHTLLNATTAPYHSLASPLVNHHKENKFNQIESDLHELPLLTGSVDLVILPHMLEFIDNPRQLLSEACRIVKPEGLIAIIGFNPYSMWGLKKIMVKHKSVPWSANSINANQIKNWLHLADFAMEKHAFAFFRPPVNHPTTFQRLHFFERIGKKCFPKLGGIYIILARAKVIPLTPIKMKWKQHLSNIPISTRISSHIARRE